MTSGALLRAAVALPAAATSTVTGSVAAFLAAAWLGSFLPSTHRDPGDGPRDVEIVILEGLLHTDILLPATPRMREAFGFARGTGLPIDAAGLRWLSIGWGSRAFYTSAGAYADIAPAAVWRAATGDEAVLRLVGFGELEDAPDLRRIRLTEQGLENLTAFALGTLRHDDAGRPLAVDASLQPGDAFFAAVWHFNLFNPCNEWTARALNEAGVTTGLWTPTTYSLSASIDRYGF